MLERGTAGRCLWKVRALKFSSEDVLSHSYCKDIADSQTPSIKNSLSLLQSGAKEDGAKKRADVDAEGWRAREAARRRMASVGEANLAALKRHFQMERIERKLSHRGNSSCCQHISCGQGHGFL